MGLPSDFLEHEIYFVLWSLVALIGLIRLMTETFPRPKRRIRPAHQIAGGGLLLLGVIAAIPHAPQALRTLDEFLKPEPPPKRLVLATDRTIDGIALRAGSIVAIRPDGDVESADLKSPHTIDGIVVNGHVDFKHQLSERGTWEARLWSGTIVADQEIPDSGGIWCSPNRRLTIDDPGFGNCEIARAVTRDGITIPAGSYMEFAPTHWTVTLPSSGAPVSIEGLRVPGGWKMRLGIDPHVTLSILEGPSDPAPEIQPWVEVHSLRLTGLIIFEEPEHDVQGELWEDATVEGKAHKKGDSVRFGR
ncbi:MAG: hypothetical protein ACLQOO_24035 [Terriglobia bacterium]